MTHQWTFYKNTFEPLDKGIGAYFKKKGKIPRGLQISDLRDRKSFEKRVGVGSNWLVRNWKAVSKSYVHSIYDVGTIRVWSGDFIRDLIRDVFKLRCNNDHSTIRARDFFSAVFNTPVASLMPHQLAQKSDPGAGSPLIVSKIPDPNRILIGPWSCPQRV